MYNKLGYIELRTEAKSIHSYTHVDLFGTAMKVSSCLVGR